MREREINIFTPPHGQCYTPSHIVEILASEGIDTTTLAHI